MNTGPTENELAGMTTDANNDGINDFEFDLLFGYSEWLDSQGLILPDSQGADKRTHEELAKEFLLYRDASEAARQDAEYVALNGSGDVEEGDSRDETLKTPENKPEPF